MKYLNILSTMLQLETFGLLGKLMMENNSYFPMSIKFPPLVFLIQSSPILTNLK